MLFSFLLVFSYTLSVSLPRVAVYYQGSTTSIIVYKKIEQSHWISGAAGVNLANRSHTGTNFLDMPNF